MCDNCCVNFLVHCTSMYTYYMFYSLYNNNYNVSVGTVSRQWQTRWTSSKTLVNKLVISCLLFVWPILTGSRSITNWEFVLEANGTPKVLGSGAYGTVSTVTIWNTCPLCKDMYVIELRTCEIGRLRKRYCIVGLLHMNDRCVLFCAETLPSLLLLCTLQ